MGIQEGQSLLHWNYFLALEADVEQLARYIEFAEQNFDVYSTELAHIFLASCSEVDVIAKQLCKQLNPESTANNITHYKNELRANFSELEDMEITIPRYALTLTPWSNWKKDRTPIWWSSHNNVKHQRNEYYPEANLKNALNSVAALFCLIILYYRNIIDGRRIEPPPNFFTPPPEVAIVCPSIGGRMAMFYAQER